MAKATKKNRTVEDLEREAIGQNQEENTRSVTQPSPEDAAELSRLRQRVADLETEKLAQSDSEHGSYMKEMENLRKAKGKGLNEIQVKEISPKTVSLWHISGHNIGKRVGPINAELAEETFLRFSFFKIRLSLSRPSEEFIAKYKQTPEYKAFAAAEVKRRAGKSFSRKESEVEKLTNAIATMQGVKPDQLNQIAQSPSQVKGRGIAVAV